LAAGPSAYCTTVGWHQARSPRLLPCVCTKPNRHGHCRGLARGLPDRSVPWICKRPARPVTAMCWHQTRPPLPWVGNRPARPVCALGLNKACPPRHCLECGTKPARNDVGWYQARLPLSMLSVATRSARPGHCLGLAPSPPDRSLLWVGTRPARPVHLIHTWSLVAVILFLTIATAFIGYDLP